MGNSGRRAGKRRRREEEEYTDTATADRLSNLPEPILCHILSFLDTKSAVKTSVLSRAWRSIWKCVPVLDLRGDGFQEASIFERFVCKVLSHRCNVNLREVSYVDEFPRQRRWRKTDKSLFMKLINYALSHDVQHLVVHGDIDDFYRFPNSLDSILNSNLKSLGLRYTVLDSGLRCFRMLTSMNLAHCMLIDEYPEDIDPFSNFPCLTNLVVRNVMPICRSMTRVSGSQLLRLELSDMEAFEIEIFASKLKFLRVSTPQRFSKLTLPSLDHAEITLASKALSYVGSFNERVQHDFHLLLKGLHNAKSLKLDANIIQVLKTICVFLEQQPSPFRRLESLIVATDRLPYKVANYLFKGSSCEEPDIIIDLGA